MSNWNADPLLDAYGNTDDVVDAQLMVSTSEAPEVLQAGRDLEILEVLERGLVGMQGLTGPRGLTGPTGPAAAPVPLGDLVPYLGPAVDAAIGTQFDLVTVYQLSN